MILKFWCEDILIIFLLPDAQMGSDKMVNQMLSRETSSMGVDLCLCNRNVTCQYYMDNIDTHLLCNGDRNEMPGIYVP